MFEEENTTETIYLVVVNHEEQYSIWPSDTTIPNGWIKTEKSGTKDDCLDYIESIWTDLRPLSLRKQIEEVRKAQDAMFAKFSDLENKQS